MQICIYYIIIIIITLVCIIINTSVIIVTQICDSNNNHIIMYMCRQVITVGDCSAVSAGTECYPVVKQIEGNIDKHA